MSQRTDCSFFFTFHSFLLLPEDSWPASLFPSSHFFPSQTRSLWQFTAPSTCFAQGRPDPHVGPELLRGVPVFHFGTTASVSYLRVRGTRLNI